MKFKQKELKEGISKCEEVIKQLELNARTTQTQINELFNKIRIKLNEKEQELLNKLEEIEKYKKKELELQKGELKLEIDNAIEPLSSQSHDVNELSGQIYLSTNIWKIEPCHNAFIEFFMNEQEEKSIYSNISNVGVLDSNEISAEKCLVSRNENQIIQKNKKFKFEIISYSKEGREIKNGGNRNNFSAQIIGETGRKKSKKSEWEIVDLNNGKYEVKMKIKEEGKYSIFVQYNGIDIFSSPFQIQVLLKQRNYNQAQLTFGSKGHENGQLDYPNGICTNLHGNIIVCDNGNHRIQIFDSKGQFISTFGSKGIENGQFMYPFGIAVNSKGNIIVCGNLHDKIQIFDSQGKFISTFGSSGKGNGQFNSPRGVCVDKNDNIYVCDETNERIQIFDSEGKFIFAFGSRGNHNGLFLNPRGIIINSKGNIIVSDCGSHKIQVFDSQGKFILAFGSQGYGNGQFRDPKGICVDANDNIYVCDDDKVQVFTSKGQYLTQFQVNRPNSITFDPKTQNLIVCGDHKVSIF